MAWSDDTARTRAAELAPERRRLVALAYRVCGSWSDAEDVVQQVSLEWLGTDAPVTRPAAWLTRVTVRRAIDALRARQRAAAYVGPWVPEPLVETRDADPHFHAEGTEALTTAFLVLAESLTPPQRAVVVLRALGYEHAEIARILDVTPAASRQHHTRGLRRLDAENGRAVGGDPGVLPRGRDASAARALERETRSLLDAFTRAARLGDTAALRALLHDEVRAYNDGGGRARAARRVLTGSDAVARFVAGVASRHVGRRAVRPVVVNGTPGLVVTLSGVDHVVSVQVRDGRLFRVFDVCNPDKQRSLRGPTAQASAAGDPLSPAAAGPCGSAPRSGSRG
ncbi:sigma factor [Cellulomonas sp.]|uniref:sigma factor n=1 Tax=Cellulomonas sp. TaxID=40001 RepID=UPI001B17AA21|nr:sigma factor [Cellulomonas sp.]MBO9556890.1 RNA polymerase subunit sigma-24 [Cellulomonas sp.]